jgi:hypothetical protein
MAATPIYYCCWSFSPPPTVGWRCACSAYAGLLWQHLLTEKRLPPDGRLPPILPVVLYNGDRRWGAPLALHDLVGLPGGLRAAAMAAGKILVRPLPAAPNITTLDQNVGFPWS